MSEALPDLPHLTKVEGAAAAPTRIDEVMTCAVVTLSPEQSFQEALSLIARHRFRHLLVVDTESRLAGVISDRDLLRFMIREPHWDSTPVAEVMRAHPVTVRPETPLSTAIAEMLTRQINCLPVVDGEGRVCGILTSTDLLRTFQQVQERIERTASR